MPRARRLLRALDQVRPTRCAVCAGWAVPARGAYLEVVANGRTICVECGRFQVHCECRR